MTAEASVYASAVVTRRGAGSAFIGAMTVLAVATSFGCGSNPKKPGTHAVSSAQQRIFTRLRVQAAQTRVRQTGGELVVAMDTNGNMVGATHSYIDAIAKAERLHAYSRAFLANNTLYGLAGYAKSLRGICDQCVLELVRARTLLLGPSPTSVVFRRAILGHGISLRVPKAWHLSTHNTTYVYDPALRFEVWLGTRPLTASAFPSPSGFDVRFMELVPPLMHKRFIRSTPRRPRHFRLSNLKRSDNDWTSGNTSSFTTCRRIFYLGVEVGSGLSNARRRQIERLLDSIRIAC